MTTFDTRPSRSSSASSGRRPGRSPKSSRRRHVWLRRVLIVAILGLLLGVVIVGSLVAYAWSSLALPPETPLVQTTFITDANDKPLSQFNSGENRVPVKIDQVPTVVVNAVLDTEDHNYFTHKGIDPRGAGRSLWHDLRSDDGSLQGGSTITQQYVKTAYLTSDRTMVRKFKEAILALKLERKYSKQEILERYLNTIYFGRGDYGIQTASRDYFGKDVQQLDLPQAAYLAGLIRAPEAADAYADPATAKLRRDLTLGSMARYGHITPQQQAEVSAMPLGGKGGYVLPRAARQAQTAMSDKGTQYFVDYVKKELVKRYGEKRVELGGLRVKTSLDLSAQSKAYDSVYGFLKPGEPAGALVSLDENGEIRAMVGGRDYKQSQVNLAVGKDGGGSGRPGGSTFKAFMLAAAIDDGMSIRETFAGPGKMVVPGWDTARTPVANFDHETFGNIDLVEATAHSVNTVYAQLVVEEGVQSLIDMAHKAGIASDLRPNNSLVLGVDDVSPLEMADAYLTFGQRGVRVTPSAILEVKDSNGQLLDKFKPVRTRVMSEKTADTVNYVLQQVVQRGTGRAAQVGKPLAGKTGTTEDNGDAWFVGYRPNLATAVWMGFPEGSQHKMSNVRGVAVTGGSFPAQMFADYMRWAVKSDDDAKFVTPANLPSPKSTTSSSVAGSSTTASTTTSTTTSAGLVPIPEEGGLEEIRPSDGKAGRGRPSGSTTTSTVEGVTTPPRPRVTAGVDLFG